MTGEKGSVRCHGKVLGTAATSGKPLVYTGATLKIYHKMKEVKLLISAMPFYHLGGKLVVLITKYGYILHAKSILLILRSHHRLH